VLITAHHQLYTKARVMRNSILLLAFIIGGHSLLRAQHPGPGAKQRKEIETLIDQYSMAREKRDTILLKQILMEDVDQLVSTGEWRKGVQASVQGMLNSSAVNTGKRTLKVDKIRMFAPGSAIVDCKYDIQNSDANARSMWSSFVVVQHNGDWKISAIRNMLPARQ
jgi:uncharacterized protein (TIGR02246 family)